MSTTLSGPALNATGSDPLNEPPPPPPASASNHPDDQAAGIAGEMAAEGQAEIADARSGKDQQQETPREAEPAAKNADGTDKTAEQIENDALKDDKTPAWMKRTITIERNKQRAAAETAKAAEERAAAAEKRLNDALEALKTRQPPEESAKPAATEAPRPTRADFDTPEAYDAAVDTWAATRADAAAKKAEADLAAKAEADRVEADKQANDKRIADQITEMNKTWTAKREKAIEQWPDYVEVAESDQVRIDVPMAHTAIQAENGAEILYHLGKNPEEAARIAALPPANQIFEIGRLSATLARGQQVDVSRAPPPLTPLNSSREAATDQNREETMEEVARRVAKRESGARTPMWGSSRATH